MDTHEEIIKLLNNICDHINNVTIEEDDKDDDDTKLTDDIKQIQTILYKLWLRLLEWECLLEQQQLGHLQQLEILADNNDEAEELFKTTTAENVAENEEISTECCQSSRSIAYCCDIPKKRDLTNNKIKNDLLSTLNTSNIDQSEQDFCPILECDILRNSGQTDICDGDQQCEKIDQSVMEENLTASGLLNSSCDDNNKSLLHGHKTSASLPHLRHSSSSSSSSSSCIKNDHSDSDSGVSDLSSDITFHQNISKFSSLNYTPKEKHVSKTNSDFSKKSKFNKKSDHFSTHLRKSVLKSENNFYDNLLQWAKLILLTMLIFFLIILTFLLTHVKCFNDICAISLETKISYYKYASPI